MRSDVLNGPILLCSQRGESKWKNALHFKVNYYGQITRFKKLTSSRSMELSEGQSKIIFVNGHK